MRGRDGIRAQTDGATRPVPLRCEAEPSGVAGSAMRWRGRTRGSGPRGCAAIAQALTKPPGRRTRRGYGGPAPRRAQADGEPPGDVGARKAPGARSDRWNGDTTEGGHIDAREPTRDDLERAHEAQRRAEDEKAEAVRRRTQEQAAQIESDMSDAVERAQAMGDRVEPSLLPPERRPDETPAEDRNSRGDPEGVAYDRAAARRASRGTRADDAGGVTRREP